MRLKHNKTDKADAGMIRQYALQQQPELWQPKIALYLLPLSGQ